MEPSAGVGSELVPAEPDGLSEGECASANRSGGLRSRLVRMHPNLTQIAPETRLQSRTHSRIDDVSSPLHRTTYHVWQSTHDVIVQRGPLQKRIATAFLL